MGTSPNSGNAAGAGLGFPGALTLLFVALKLTHVIAWSWRWVLSPIWISAALFVLGTVVVVIVACVSVARERRHRARRGVRGRS